MKAAFFREHGDVDVVEVGDVPDPIVGPEDVQVQVKACALNRLDIFVRQGWPGLKLEMPHIGGTDIAGVVSDVGPRVHDVAVGDEVIVNPGLNFEEDPAGRLIVPAQPSIVGETRSGGLAEVCVVPASRVVPKPAAWSWEEAAAFPLTALTVMRMLRKAGAQAGHRVLVVGAGGGIGVMAVQLASASGCEVYATTAGEQKVDAVRSLGADHVFDYRQDPAWSKAVYQASGRRGMDIVIDAVGQATWAHSLRSLSPGGRLVTCGATTGPIGETDIRLVFWRQLSILGSTMGSPQDLERALVLAEAGKVRPVVDSVWSLDQVREAQRKMEQGEHIGKIVVVP